MINKERLLSKFLEYVQIDSESTHEGQMALHMKKELEDLGFEVEIEAPSPISGSETGNIIAKLKGDESKKPLLFSAHMDTVVPGIGVKPVVKDGFVYSDGTTVLGSDDKSGIAEVLEAVHSAQEQGIKTIPVEIIFSVCEEIGLLGAKSADLSKFDAEDVIVLDSGGPAGTIVKAAPGQVSFEATFKGKASHAGSAPEKGISAIITAANAISEMELLRIDEETTANIGTFEASVPTNIVCDRAYIKGEIRSRNIDKLNAHVEQIKGAIDSACKKTGAEVDCKFTTTYEPYALPEDFPLIVRVKEACIRCGFEANVKNGGGGSDANVMNKKGKNAIVISSGMTKVHTTEEHINIKVMEDTAELILELIKA